MPKILVTGGTGLIGGHLIKKLLAENYSVSVLSRSKSSIEDIEFYQWNVRKGEVDINAVKSCDYIIHMAGANIAAKKWTQKRKEEIINSRTQSTQLLFDTVKKHNPKLKAFISASAVGYYGAITSDHIYNESDKAHDDFLGRTTQKWEEAADKFISLGIRVLKLRTGIVLAENSEALAKMTKPIKLNVGAALGSGKQYMPWIHIDDVCSAYINAIKEEKMNGAYNLVAPQHINNKDFTKLIASILKKPLWLPNIPSFMLRLLFGEMAKLFLFGSRVSSKKLLDTGFSFKYTKLEMALKKLL
ncbi:hypothetical protein GGR42_002042 [Saonia flava]|uniref:TIGR01777 family protein n=1 Tax=Saonia flava TaxID=523696 RepID=A0A846QXB9_9FLAO|nr:TIGR01777 family oxidoreductase [Saonia flava]NJB71580.1 hypothetical protein [Saonia flava]